MPWLSYMWLMLCCWYVDPSCTSHPRSMMYGKCGPHYGTASIVIACAKRFLICFSAQECRGEDYFQKWKWLLSSFILDFLLMLKLDPKWIMSDVWFCWFGLKSRNIVCQWLITLSTLARLQGMRRVHNPMITPGDVFHCFPLWAWV
jgi:hypothetical protein